MKPWRVWRPSDNLAVDDDFPWKKLGRGQVNLGAVGKPIPVVVAHLASVYVDLPKNHITTEQVLNHQCRHPALVTRRILWPPLRPGGPTTLRTRSGAQSQIATPLVAHPLHMPMRIGGW